MEPTQTTRLKKIVVAGAMNNLLFAGLGAALTYLQSLIALRILGPGEIGLFAMASAIALTIEGVSDFGIGDRLVQDDDTDFRAKFDTAATVYLILAFVLALLTVALAPLMSRLYKQPALTLLVMAISYTAFTGFLELPLSLLIRELKYVQQRALLLLGRAVSFAITIVLAFRGMGAWSLVAGGFAGLLATGIPAWALCDIRPRWRISSALLKPMLRFSSPVWISKIAYVLVHQGAVLVLSAYLVLDDVGRFKSSEQIANPIYYVETVLVGTMFPVFCRMKDSNERLSAAFSKTSRVSMLWIAASAIGLVLFAPEIVRYVLTPRWQGSEFFLRAQGIALFFGAMISSWDSLLKARNRTRMIFAMSVFFAICFLVIFVPAVVLWGRVGAAAGVIAVSAVTLLARVFVLRRLGLGISIVEIGWRAWTAGALAVAAVLALSGISHSDSFGFSAVKLAVFLSAYMCVLGLLEQNLLREILSLALPKKAAPEVLEHQVNELI